jgi:stage II sporulation protein R
MKRRYVLAVIAIFMVLMGTMMNVKWSHMKADLAGKVFRFHVLANSDREEDQALKMRVKEEILAYMKQELPTSDSAEITKAWARANLHNITDRAQQLVKREGYDYTVTAKVTSCDFPEKSYGDITFPAGEYEALRIEIGESKGQNWWCVAFPSICFRATSSEIEAAAVSEGFSEEEVAFITGDAPVYRLRFKTLELLDQLKIWLLKEK